MCSIVFSNAAVAVLAVLAAFLARPLLSFWRKWHVLGRLPSPPVSDPVWGHFSNIAAETAHLEFKTWAKELGPCFLLRLLHLPMLVVTDPGLLQTGMPDRVVSLLAGIDVILGR